MKKLIIVICLLVSFIGSSASAQTPPEVEVVMSTDSAGQNDIIYADVYVHSDDIIIGADIGIQVDSECLRIEGRENGQYLPTTAEESGFVPFEELTTTSTRLAASVLGQEVVADGSHYFFRVALRVLCAEDQANVTISFAQIVNKDLESYSLEDGQVVVTEGSVAMGPGQPVIATAPVFPTPTEYVIPTLSTTTTSSTHESDDSQFNPLLVIIVALILVVVVLVLVLLLILRRQRKS